MAPHDRKLLGSRRGDTHAVPTTPMTEDDLTDALKTFVGVWQAILAEQEELSPVELDVAASAPEDLDAGLAALVPVVARAVHPDVARRVIATLMSVRETLHSGPGEVRGAPIETDDLHLRVERIEVVLRAAGAWCLTTLR